EEENGNYFIEIDGLAPSDNYLFEMIGFGVDKEYTDEDGNTIPTEDSKYEGFPYYTDGTAHSINISIDRPTPVDFSVLHHTDVLCFSESNGTISIQASGGNNGGYEYQLSKNGTNLIGWTGFSSTNSTVISGLSQGEYGIRVRDANACLAKEIVLNDSGGIEGLGNVREEFTTIMEPLPLLASIIDLETKEPR